MYKRQGPRDHDLAFKDGTSTKLRSLSVPILSKGDANKAVAVLHVATEHDDPMWQESLVGAKECVEGVLNSGNDDWFRT